MTDELFQAAHDQLAAKWMDAHPEATEDEAYAATEDKAHDRAFEMAVESAEAYFEGDR
jgi:hypothetical protein